jgi:hypothetical protein
VFHSYLQISPGAPSDRIKHLVNLARGPWTLSALDDLWWANRWEERACAWDDRNRALERISLDEQRLEMTRRHRGAARNLHDTSANVIEGFLSRLEWSRKNSANGEYPTDVLKFRDAVHALELSQKLETLSLQQAPPEVPRENWAVLSDDEFTIWQAISAKLRT